MSRLLFPTCCILCRKPMREKFSLNSLEHRERGAFAWTITQSTHVFEPAYLLPFFVMIVFNLLALCVSKYLSIFLVCKPTRSHIDVNAVLSDGTQPGEDYGQIYIQVCLVYRVSPQHGELSDLVRERFCDCLQFVL